MPEPRTGVMICVEASWEDQNGALQVVPARIVDKSTGGACIELKTRIGVGSKLRIKWRRGQFSGVAKYCRRDGLEYLVGIQRDATLVTAPSRPIPASITLQGNVKTSDLPVLPAPLQGQPKSQATKPIEVSETHREMRDVPVVQVANCAITTPPPAVSHEIGSSRLAISQPQSPNVLQPTELQTKQSPTRKDSERKLMRRKWLDVASWHTQDEQSEGGDASSNGRAMLEKQNRAPQMALPVEKIPADAPADSVPCSPAELLPMEDIYRTAGIMNPRRGYGIGKVVEMLHSEHLRGLSHEMRRAAVLMALHAAGIPIEEVLQDAKTRRDALDSYEAGQRELVEADWARRAEENVQIQEELERVKAHYMARIGRNLEGIEREKAAFGDWLETKQQESQNMADAAELCMRPSVTKPAVTSLADIAVAVSTKLM